MDEIRDCGGSYFDDDDKVFLEDLKDRFDNGHKAQLEAPDGTLDHTYTQPESSPDLHHAETFTLNTTHTHDQHRRPTLPPSLVAVENLSDGIIRSTDPFDSATSTFSPQQPTNSEPHQTSPQEPGNDLFNMPRLSQRSSEDTQDFQLEDEIAYQFPLDRPVFQSTEEEEDFREQLKTKISPQLSEFNEDPFPLQQESYAQSRTTRGHVLSQPPITSMTEQSESRDQDQSQIPQSLGQTPISTQHIQGTKPPRPTFLTPSQRPHDVQQTPRTGSQAQIFTYCTWPQKYQGAYPGIDSQPPTSTLTSSNRAPPQTMASLTNITNDPTMQALLASAPGIDLSEPRLTNRCRGMEYIPFRTAEETKRIHDDHAQRMRDLITRLRAAIARRLSGTGGLSAAFNSNVAIVQKFLYVNAIRVLRIRFDNPKVFADQGDQNQESTQLKVLYQLLQHIDCNIRPKGPVHMENSLKAWEVAALKWQREIHEDWITELNTGKKRYAPDDENDDESNDGEGGSSKRHRKDGSTRADDRPSRKPGRPPGSLNKSTIRAKAKQEARIKEEQRKQKTSLPALSDDDVRKAKANAAKFASRDGSGSGPGPAVLTSPWMTAAAAPAPTRVHRQSQGRYPPQPQQNPLRPGYGQQTSSRPFTNPSMPAPPQRLVHHQSSYPHYQLPQLYLRSQPHPPQYPQNLLPNPLQPPSQPRQYPSFLISGAPPPGVAQRLVYPDPAQPTRQQGYHPFSHQVPPRPGSLTVPALGTANPASTGYTHPSASTQQSGNSSGGNDVDVDGDEDDGGTRFTRRDYSTGGNQ